MAYLQQFQVSWKAMDFDASDVVQPGTSNLDYTGGHQPSCQIGLVPYPAPGVGCYTVLCVNCSVVASIMTRGDMNDPSSVTIGCMATRDGIQYIPDDT
jgi:hypothetical protein